MDFELVKKGLVLSPKAKKWLIALGIIGASSYGAYRVYSMPSIVRKRMKIMKLLGALLSVGEMVSESAEAVSVISKDLREFLQSDSNEIPNSLKQLSKIAQSDELSKALGRVSEGVTSGVLRGYKSQEKMSGSSTFADKLIDRLISSAGTGFASVVVGSFAKNLAMGVCSNSSTFPGWADAMCDDRFKGLISECIQTFVSTAVAVYLDKTMHINFYDDLFSGMTNPNHQAEVRKVMVSLCNGAVETLVKTSHQVLTANPDTPSLASSSSIDGHRRFVLDVTGRVTFETVRSIAEFITWKMTERLKASVSVVQEEVSQRGIDGFRYICAKSSVILKIWLVVFLHICWAVPTLSVGCPDLIDLYYSVD